MTTTTEERAGTRAGTRWDVRGHLADLDYPATRDDILRIACRSDADDETIARIRSLPAASFNGTYEVCRSLAAR
ncbi:DUF2795 domain-containing protein [Compostimonas suwonensis]|uniref:Uncharacterized protein DUF2795 n=1 Tax=Compostimonas suwonensis TaxID=1048394 RepID=A0A2M9BCG5_9MICO|nr:DUF2795 domain-containing protein [Compostimonas suwonensis]PJJ55594.1 uncharacterized protein DUF2795 [Compostimonas suwonensis]